MKLWVIGEKSPNPEEWNRVKQFSLIIAESAERAIQCAGHGINEFVTEVNMTVESGIFYRGTMNVPKKNRVQRDKKKICLGSGKLLVEPDIILSE